MTPAEKAQAERNYKQLARCIPASSLDQLRLARTLTTPAGRSALITRCGIPPRNREVAEAKILDAAVHGHLTTKDGRHVFFTVTLPKIIVQEQA